MLCNAGTVQLTLPEQLVSLLQEAGAGSPGLSLAGVVDALAAAGRRACYYDRLGYGWSDETVKPAYARRVSVWEDASD